MPIRILPFFFACCMSVAASCQASFLMVGDAEPPTLDLRDADPGALVPKNDLNEAEIENVRTTWEKLIKQFHGERAIQIKLPNGAERGVLLLGASQALKAQNPSVKLYLAYDECAPANWDEIFWGALDGGAISPTDIPGQPETWQQVLNKAQEQLPARPWTMWCPIDPGPELPLLLGYGAWLVVPSDGAAAALAESIPEGLGDIEADRGMLTLRGGAGQGGKRAFHWQFDGSKWEPYSPAEESVQVVLKGKTDYDVYALLAKARAAQLRDRAALQTQESRLSINIHAQTGRGSGADLGFVFISFEKVGEPEELLQEQVLVNGVSANIRGGMQLPIVESKRSISPPVALSLTERYRYSDGGPGGTDARWIRFAPAVDDPTLFTGQILIFESTGRIMEERSERSDLPGIVKSERRKIIYGEPALGHWRALEIQTFERWVLSGGVAQIRRNLVYSNFKINQSNFNQSRLLARNSNSAMLRQTEDGVRYLTKNKDGSRTLEHKQRTFGRAIGGAIMADPALSFPVVPAAALALFDFDAFGKGIQYNAIIAGIFNMGTLNVPHLPGGFDLGVSARGGILAFTDRPTKNGELLEKDGVARQSGQVSVSIGRDLGLGFRARLHGLGIYNRFADAKEEEYRTPGYVIPPSGMTLGLSSELTWMHSGFQLRGNYGEGKRPNGFYGPLDDVRPIADGGKYKVWGAMAGYNLRLKSIAWFHGEVGVDGGSGFDRFHSLAIGGMGGGGGRVAGIRSNAVATDRVQYASLGYIFPASPMFRISCSIDHARSHSMDDQKAYGFTGLGLAGDIPGFGWFTTIRADIGIGLQSDIPGVKVINGFIALLRVF
jgi:hypothetical protein